MSDKPRRISPRRGTPRVPLPQLERFMALRGVTQDALMEHLGLTPQSWHSTQKAGGWFVTDLPAIAGLLEVSPELLQAKGIERPETGPAVALMLQQPEIAAITATALSDIAERLQAAMAALVEESLARIAVGAVPLPSADVASAEATKLRELEAIATAQHTARRTAKSGARANRG